MRIAAITGLLPEQVGELVARIAGRLGTGGALGLYDSVVLVLFLPRRNPVQQVAAGISAVSQATVSRRWDLLRPLIEPALADLSVDPHRRYDAGRRLHLPDLELEPPRRPLLEQGPPHRLQHADRLQRGRRAHRHRPRARPRLAPRRIRLRRHRT